jgi:HAD superfamily phosphoserine phosphatase-like hydrolase
VSQSAAFFRVEGSLSPRPTLTAAAWFAGNAQHVGERFARLSNVALAAPFLFGSPLRDATVGSRMAWMGLRGMSEDRLIILGEEYFTDYVEPKLRTVGVDLLEKARERGQKVVLISDNLEAIVRPLAQHLEVPDYVCNRMEVQKGKCTGRLVEPIINGNLASKWAKSFAAEHGIDLARSYAYGSEADDGLLLESIGQPCAIHPDRQLRAMARDLDWPVLEG